MNSSYFILLFNANQAQKSVIKKGNVTRWYQVEASYFFFYFSFWIFWNFQWNHFEQTKCISILVSDTFRQFWFDWQELRTSGSCVHWNHQRWVHSMSKSGWEEMLHLTRDSFWHLHGKLPFLLLLFQLVAIIELESILPNFSIRKRKIFSVFFCYYAWPF